MMATKENVDTIEVDIGEWNIVLFNHLFAWVLLPKYEWTVMTVMM